MIIQGILQYMENYNTRKTTVQGILHYKKYNNTRNITSQGQEELQGKLQYKKFYKEFRTARNNTIQGI